MITAAHPPLLWQQGRALAKGVGSQPEQASRKHDISFAFSALGHPHHPHQATMAWSSVHSVIERDALGDSSAVFVYDSTPSAPFGGSLTADHVYRMQARDGAGSSLVGFVESLAFSSKGAAHINGSAEADDADARVPAKRHVLADQAAHKAARSSGAFKPVSILTGTDAFLALAPVLPALPPASARPALSIHVSAQSSATEDDSLAQVPRLAPFLDAAQLLKESSWPGAVVLSDSAADAAAVGTTLAKRLAAAGHDLVHAFDGLTVGRAGAQIAAPVLDGEMTGSLEDTIASVVPSFFSYYGSPDATDIIVLPASVHSATARFALAALADAPQSVGILTARVLKPWSSAQFLAALPRSAQTLHLFAEGLGSRSALREDVAASALESSARLRLRTVCVDANEVPSVDSWARTILSVAKLDAAPVFKAVSAPTSKLATFWSSDKSASAAVADAVAAEFGKSQSGTSAQLETRFDNFAQGGIRASYIAIDAASSKPRPLVSNLAAITPPSLLFVSAANTVVKAYNPFSGPLSQDSSVVLGTPWSAGDLASKLPLGARRALVKASPRVFVIDSDKLARELNVRPVDVEQAAFWKLFAGDKAAGVLAGLAAFKGQDHVQIATAIGTALKSVDVQSLPTELAADMDSKKREAAERTLTLPATVVPTAAGPSTFTGPPDHSATTKAKSWHGIAQRLMFPEAFGLVADAADKMRPDLPERNYLVTVSENRRLTPSNYDRNVFHIEFSTAGTGLNYAVGEALGVHGWNDDAEVLEFLRWYGLDPEQVVDVPARLDAEGTVETRTVFQLFQQNLDIFGKPGKSFYETLSKHATDVHEARTLRFISSPEGASTFKKWSETDTVTYADVLRAFPSARLGLAELLREVEEIKPRHYSIASAQNFVGDSVHLLIVTVEWMTPKGESDVSRKLAHFGLTSIVRLSALRPVHALPRASQAWFKGHGLGEAVRHEGVATTHSVAQHRADLCHCSFRLRIRSPSSWLVLAQALRHSALSFRSARGNAHKASRLASSFTTSARATAPRSTFTAKSSRHTSKTACSRTLASRSRATRSRRSTSSTR